MACLYACLGVSRFMAAMSPSGCLSVVLDARATPEDMLKAYFLCVVFWEKVGGVIFSAADCLRHKASRYRSGHPRTLVLAPGKRSGTRGNPIIECRL